MHNCPVVPWLNTQSRDMLLIHGSRYPNSCLNPTSIPFFSFSWASSHNALETKMVQFSLSHDLPMENHLLSLMMIFPCSFSSISQPLMTADPHYIPHHPHRILLCIYTYTLIDVYLYIYIYICIPILLPLLLMKTPILDFAKISHGLIPHDTRTYK